MNSLDQKRSSKNSSFLYNLPMSKLIAYKDYLVAWLKQEVSKAKLDGVIVGLSGGVDSAVVAAIAKEAFPDNSLAVYMPIGDMGVDLEDAKDVAKKIKIDTQTIDLTNSFNEMAKVVNVQDKLSVANIKPRLRMTALYALAQENRYLVLGTDNAAEWVLGYFTKYGDGGVDLLPIAYLTKGEVKLLAKEMDLPERVYTKAPTAALWDGQTDETELGFSYDEVDKYLRGISINEDIKVKIEKQIEITNHKREDIPMPKPM